MKNEYSKPFKKEMRRIAGIAYQREMDEELGKLYEQFKKWEKKEIDCFQLNDIIHKYHDGISRQLYKLNQMGADYLAIRALAKNIIKEEEADKNLIEASKDKIESFKSLDLA